mgnify:CR=1 FL=1
MVQWHRVFSLVTLTCKARSMCRWQEIWTIKNIYDWHSEHAPYNYHIAVSIGRVVFPILCARYIQRCSESYTVYRLIFDLGHWCVVYVRVEKVEYFKHKRHSKNRNILISWSMDRLCCCGMEIYDHSWVTTINFADYQLEFVMHPCHFWPWEGGKWGSQ